MSIVRTVTFLALALALLTKSKAQTIFSTLHVNEERYVHRGVPKKISETTILVTAAGRETKEEVTTFDKSGLPLFKKHLDENGDLVSTTSFRYDTTHRVIIQSDLKEFKVRTKTDRVRTLYYYNGSRSPVNIQHLNAEGRLVSEVVLKNGALGLPVELSLYEPPGNFYAGETATYIPNQNKAIVRILDYNGKTLTVDSMKISFKDAYKFHDPLEQYNEQGDVIASQSKWSDGSIHYSEYDYKYDHVGNWTKQERFELKTRPNGKKKRELKSIITRKIDYRK